MMKKSELKEILKQTIAEEYKGFAKDKAYKLKPEDDGFDKVKYLPKFDEIRRDLKSFSSQFKPYTDDFNPDIAQLAKDITKTFNQLGKYIYIFDKNLNRK